MKIEQLLRLGRTVFTINDLAVIWQISKRRQLVEIVKYYTRAGKLHRLRRGVYALDQKYDSLEAAQKLFPPCYISYHTALGIHGINFQHYEDVHAMAERTLTISITGKKFVYHQLREDLLLSSLGINQEANHLLASPERAIVDSLYLSPHMTFDHLDRIDWELLTGIATIYGNQSLIGRTVSLKKEHHA